MSQFAASIAAALALASPAFAAVPPAFHDVKSAHAVLAPIVFALFMPLGAIMIRICKFRGVLWFHAGWMVFSYIVSLAALGTGVWLAYYIKLLGSAHAIIGLVVIVGCLMQPVTGLIHHLLYKKVGGPNRATYPHVWWGRALVTLGAINGLTGLQLARSTKETEIGYGVGALVVWIIWMGVILRSFLLKRGEGAEKMFAEHGNDGQIKKFDSPVSAISESDKEITIV